MLCAQDESILHQAAVPFSQTTISDHRFFDRLWFDGFGLNGVRFMAGMAAYKNMNVVDGYFTVCHGHTQHNLRLSRPMLPDAAAMSVGPLSVEVIEPLQKIALRLRPTSECPVSAELIFTGSVPPHQETHHFGRVSGRIAQDYTRYDQVGRFDGILTFGDERIEVESWFGARDHSWGVRPGVGAYEPVTSSDAGAGNPDDLLPGDRGFLLISLMFDSPEYAGYFQLHEDGAGHVLYRDGTCFRKVRGNSAALSVVQVEHSLRFVDGTRTWESARLQVTLSDGQILAIDGVNLLPAWCFKGTGYDFGYRDQKGLGLFRGNLLEYDQYDLSHAEDVVLPDGRRIRPWHREADAKITVNGAGGFAHFAVISSGPVQRYGLRHPATNRE